GHHDRDGGLRRSKSETARHGVRQHNAELFDFSAQPADLFLLNCRAKPLIGTEDWLLRVNSIVATPLRRDHPLAICVVREGRATCHTRTGFSSLMRGSRGPQRTCKAAVHGSL